MVLTYNKREKNKLLVYSLQTIQYKFLSILKHRQTVGQKKKYIYIMNILYKNFILFINYCVLFLLLQYYYIINARGIERK